MNTNVFTTEITDETLQTASNMFMYLTAPSSEFWINVLRIYSNWLGRFSKEIMIKHKELSIFYEIWKQGHFLCNIIRKT